MCVLFIIDFLKLKLNMQKLFTNKPNEASICVIYTVL